MCAVNTFIIIKPSLSKGNSRYITIYTQHTHISMITFLSWKYYYLSFASTTTSAAFNRRSFTLRARQLARRKITAASGCAPRNACAYVCRTSCEIYIYIYGFTCGHRQVITSICSIYRYVYIASFIYYIRWWWYMAHIKLVYRADENYVEAAWSGNYLLRI